jgi:hypothetical protein
MTVHFVSLILKEPQLIIPNEYQIIRFPTEGESYDPHNMHALGMGIDWRMDDRAGLIVPSKRGLGILEANIHWEKKSRLGGYTKICDKFDRHLIGGVIDSTGYAHRNPCRGMQCIEKMHTLIVKPGAPLGLRVKHNDRNPRRVTHAQFKLTILDVE